MRSGAEVFGNVPAQSELKIPLKKLAVVQICREYGVDISGREESLLKYGYAGSAAPEDIGRIDLFPNAFADEEQLLRTVIHEGCHVRQFKKYGGSYVQENRRKMEEVAERYENFFFNLKRRLKNGKVF